MINSFITLSIERDQQARNEKSNSDLDDYYDDEDDFDSDGYDDDYIYRQDNQSGQHYQPQMKVLDRFTGRINVDFFESSSKRSNNRQNASTYSNMTRPEGVNKIRDKHDRATVEQVLDPRTRLIIFKLLNRGIIHEINGCISTGKEANVYHAYTRNNIDEYAIKIYKTSILIFKDRDKYVTGEFRFRHGYSRHNPRKMVRTWAEKEMRNYLRMWNAGIPVPEPIILRSHVLVMRFCGENSLPAPKLKDVDLSTAKARELYRDCIIIMWKIYNKCHLVHADLSEFNILVHQGQLVIIDVSQSVEHDHPHALEFLRKDCKNISEFFRKKLVATATIRELFDFITDSTINDDNMEQYLESLAKNIENRNFKDLTAQELIDEAVWQNTFIPKRLDEVRHFERDVTQRNESETAPIYGKITGLNENLEVQTTPAILKTSLSTNEIHLQSNDGRASDDSNSEYFSLDEDEIENQHSKFVNSARPRDESPNSKRNRKKATREAKAEKRKDKIKKHIKKRKEKSGSSK